MAQTQSVSTVNQVESPAALSFLFIYSNVVNIMVYFRNITWTKQPRPLTWSFNLTGIEHIYQNCGRFQLQIVNYVTVPEIVIIECALILYSNRGQEYVISLIKAKTYPNVTADVNTYAVLLFIDSSITNFHSLITGIKSKIGQTHSQFTKC